MFTTALSPNDSRVHRVKGDIQMFFSRSPWFRKDDERGGVTKVRVKQSHQMLRTSAIVGESVR